MGHLIPAGTGFPTHRDMKIITLGDTGASSIPEGEAEPALA
jgi:DNA-directed RNA polymerase subunit beta'